MRGGPQAFPAQAWSTLAHIDQDADRQEDSLLQLGGCWFGGLVCGSWPNCGPAGGVLVGSDCVFESQTNIAEPRRTPSGFPIVHDSPEPMSLQLGSKRERLMDHPVGLTTVAIRVMVEESRLNWCGLPWLRHLVGRFGCTRPRCWSDGRCSRPSGHGGCRVS